MDANGDGGEFHRDGVRVAANWDGAGMGLKLVEMGWERKIFFIGMGWG